MAYSGVDWRNKPNHTSPINAANLEIMDNELVYLDGKATEFETDISGTNGAVNDLATLKYTAKLTALGKENRKCIYAAYHQNVVIKTEDGSNFTPTYIYFIRGGSSSDSRLTLDNTVSEMTLYTSSAFYGVYEVGGLAQNIIIENLDSTYRQIDNKVLDLAVKVDDNIGPNKIAIPYESEDINTNYGNNAIQYSGNTITGTTGSAPWGHTYINVTAGEIYSVKVRFRQTYKKYYCLITDNSGTNIIAFALSNSAGDNKIAKESVVIPTNGARMYISSYALYGWGNTESIMKATLITHEDAIYENMEKISELSPNSVPVYYVSHINAKIDAINALTEKCLHGDQFVFITDYHKGKNTDNSPYLIKNLMENTGIHFVASGGDELDVYSTKAEAEKVLANYNNIFGEKTFNTIGNHEYNDPNAQHEERRLSHATVYGIVYRRRESELIHNLGTAYCYTNETQKIKYFFLGCTYNARADYNDIQWIGDMLTQAEGYKIVVFSHLGLMKSSQGVVSVISSIQTLIEILYAFRRHTSYSDENVSVDYTSFTEEQIVIGVLSGHCHFDDIRMYKTVPVIATTCDACNSELGSLERTAGTITEQAFEVATLDEDDAILYLTRIGAGADRIVHWNRMSAGTGTTLTSELSGTLTWESGNENYATVSNGVITVVTLDRTVMISATDENGITEYWFIFTTT